MIKKLITLFERRSLGLTPFGSPASAPGTVEQIGAGHYAGANLRRGVLHLWRDPLGSNKLFYGPVNTDTWIASDRLHRLVAAGVSLSELWSCPPGAVLSVTSRRVRSVAAMEISTLPAREDLIPETLHNEARTLLDGAFIAIGQQFPNARVVVCLSGGLDSSVIASFAKKHFADVIACSFSFTEGRAALTSGRIFADPATIDCPADVSADFRSACRVAAAIGMPLMPVFRDRSAVAAALPAAVRLGQDWRDFNVHCAIVNLFLAQEIRARFPGETVIVLTGDIMNELVCDYHEEIIDGATYYPQPNVSIGRRRRFFVGGMDSSDREVGVFSAFGLTAVQPFAAVASLYMQLPPRFLTEPDIKMKLNAPLLAPEVLAAVSAAKTRAQVGGKDGGVLGICHRMGIDQKALESLWLTSFGAGNESGCLKIIQTGRYRSQPATSVREKD